jgi:uncharacterized tellurite resistance protein B-like protein
MHIVGALLGAILSGLFLWVVWGNGREVIGMWIDKYNAGVRAKKDAVAIAANRRKALAAPLRAIDDPREGALVVLMRVCLARGEVTPEQREVIAAIAREKFDLTERVEHHLSLAEFAAKQAPSSEDVINSLVPLFHDRLTDDERGDLLLMLDQVASLHGGPTDVQETFVARFRTKLGYKPNL